MLNLTNEDSYKSYFEAIATQHVSLTQFKFGDEDVIRTAAKTGLQEKTLWADRHQPTEIRDERFDNFLGERQATIMVMSPDKEKHADQQALYNTCEAIVTDIISRILKDFNDGLLSTQFSRYKYGEGEIELGSTRYRGCRLDLFWEAPVELEYAELNWEDSGVEPITAFTYTNNNQIDAAENLQPMVPQITGGSGVNRFELDVNDILPAGVTLNPNTGIISFGDVGLGDYEFDVLLNGIATVRVSFSVTGEAVTIEPSDVAGLTFWTKSEILDRPQYNVADYQLNNEANAALNGRLLTGNHLVTEQSRQEQVTLGGSMIFSDSAWTWAAWVYAPGGNSGILIGGSGGQQLRVQSGDLNMNFTNIGGATNWNSYYHIGIRKSGGIVYVYRNGILVNTASAPAGFNGSQIGRDGGAYVSVQGLADLVFKQGADLGESFIQDLYNKPNKFIEIAQAQSCTHIYPFSESETFSSQNVFNYGTLANGTFSTNGGGAINPIVKGLFRGFQTALSGQSNYNYLVSLLRRVPSKTNYSLLDAFGSLDVDHPIKTGWLNLMGLSGGVSIGNIGNTRDLFLALCVEDASDDRILIDPGTPADITLTGGVITCAAFSSIQVDNVAGTPTITDKTRHFVHLSNGANVNIDNLIIPQSANCLMIPPITYNQPVSVDDITGLYEFIKTLY